MRVDECFHTIQKQDVSCVTRSAITNLTPRFRIITRCPSTDSQGPSSPRGFRASSRLFAEAAPRCRHEGVVPRKLDQDMFYQVVMVSPLALIVLKATLESFAQ